MKPSSFFRSAGTAFTIFTVFNLFVTPIFAQIIEVTPPPVTAPAPAPTPEVTPAPTPTPAPAPVSTEPVTQPAAQPVEQAAAPIVAPADTTPPIISDVAEAALATTDATVVWTTDELATSHFHYGLTTSYGSEVTLGVSAALVHTATMLGLTPNTTYHYCLDATDISGNTSTSCDHHFTTAAPSNTIVADTNPPTISLITIAPIATSTASVNWTTDEVADGEVEYGLTAGHGSTSNLNTDLALTHSITLQNLSPDTLYHYRIKSHDEVGNISVSPDETFMTGALPVSGAAVLTSPEATSTVTTSAGGTNTPVGALSLLISSIDTRSVGSYEATVSWHTDLLSDGYVEYGNSELFGSLIGSDGLTTEHSIAITGLTPNTNYLFRVKSKTADAPTAIVSGNHEFNTLALPTPASIPANVSGVQASPVGTTTATVTWSTDQAATSQVEYGLSTEYGQASVRDADFETAHEAALADLAPDTVYHYRVKSVDNAANITYSDDHTFTTVPSHPAAPSIPEAVAPSFAPPMVTVLEVFDVATSTATIGWTSDQETAGHVDYGVSTSYGQSGTAGSSLELAHGTTLQQLAPNTTYHFHVVSTNAAGVTTYSNDQTFATAALPSVTNSNHVQTPAPVIEAHVSASLAILPILEATPSSAVISWSTDQSTTGQIEYGLTTSYGQTGGADSSAQMSHRATLNGLTPATVYHYRVKAINAAGDATDSDDQEFLTPASPSAASPAPVPTTPPTSAAVAHVAVSGITASAAGVTWNTDALATGQVEYGVSSAYGQTSGLDASLQSSHGIALSGLTADTTYHYRVKSINEAGQAAYSIDQTFATEPLASVTNPTSAPSSVDAPTANATLAVSNHDPSSATLTWSVAAPDADAAMEYDIRYSKQPITEENFVDAAQDQTTPIFYADLQPTGTQRTYDVAGLDPNTTYYFSFKTKYERSAWSLISNEPSVKTSAQTGATNNAEAGFVAGAQDVTLPANSPSGSSGASSGSGGGGATSAPYTGGGGGGSVYTPASVNAPTFLHAQGADQQIVLAWTNPDERSFVRTVIVKKDGGYPASATDGQVIYEGRAETFTDTGLTNGTTYFYALYSYNGAKKYSPQVNVSLTPVRGNTEVALNENPIMTDQTTSDHFVKTFKKGMKDIEVEHLQQILAADHHLYPEQLITGYFGTLTENALKKFQAAHKLPQTGITDEATRKELNAASQSLVTMAVPEDAVLFDTDLHSGQSGDAVATLQEFLLREGSNTKNQITGKFDADTKKAVIAFQKKYHVQPASGYVGYKTRHVMRTISGL